MDERPMPVAEHVKTHEQRAVQGAARCCVGIARAKEIFDSVWKQQFVSNDLLVPVQDC
jgi:hypothetical protein